MTLVRALASLTLGLSVIVGLLYLLVVVNIAQSLQDPDIALSSMRRTPTTAFMTKCS